VVGNVGGLFILPCRIASFGLRMTARGLVGVRVVGGALTASEALQRAGNALARGDTSAFVREYSNAIDDVRGARSDLGRALAPCFPAGTPLLTPQGDKPIDQFREGDLVLAAPEDDPDGAIESRRVEAVFIRVAPLLNLHVGGRVIRTTAEHPFYAAMRGWIPAGMLEMGDLLRSHDGQWLPVEALTESGEVTTVYNLEVAGYHTYFVGCPEWGFAVWAHNGGPAYTRDASGQWYDKAGNPVSAPPISLQKQAGHIAGTPQHANRLKAGKPTSTFDAPATANDLVIEAWASGTPVPGRPDIRERDFGSRVGTGPGGGGQSSVRVHQDATGRIHGHPCGPET
jgi:hypothetical protein